MGQRLHFWLTWRAVLVIIFLLPNTKPNGKGQYCCGGNPMQQPGPVSMDHVLLALQETKEERDQRIRGLFNFFDARGAGHLDYAQIEAGLSALHIPSEYKYAKDLLNVCDANKHGRVDYQEFRRYMDNKELELYCIFQAIDVAHHGGILPVELYDALVRAEPGPLVQQGCGMISGALGAICVYPLQVIRTSTCEV